MHLLCSPNTSHSLERNLTCMTTLSQFSIMKTLKIQMTKNSEGNTNTLDLNSSRKYAKKIDIFLTRFKPQILGMETDCLPSLSALVDYFGFVFSLFLNEKLLEIKICYKQFADLIVLIQCLVMSVGYYKIQLIMRGKVNSFFSKVNWSYST